MNRISTINDIKSLCMEAKNIISKDNERAQYLIEEAYLKANDIYYKEGIASCLLLLGMLKYAKGEFSAANEYYENCLECCKSNNFIEIEVKVLNQLGDIRHRVNDYDSALEYYLSCLEMLTINYNNLEEKVNVLYSLGTIYMELEQYTIGIEYYKEVLDIIRDKDVKEMLSKVNTSIAKCYINEGELELAREYVVGSINIAVEKANDYDIGFAYMVYAKWFYAMKEYDSAYSFYNKSIAKFQSLHSETMLSEAMTEYSIVLFQQKDYIRCVEMLEETSIILLNIKNYKLELKVYLYLAKVYEILNDCEKALKFYKRYVEMKTVNDETWKTIKVKNIINKYEHLRTNIKVKELINTNDNLVVFSKLGREITSVLDIKKIFNKISTSIFELINCELFGIGFINDKDTMTYSINDGEEYREIVVPLNITSNYLSRLINEETEFKNNNFEILETYWSKKGAEKFGFDGVRSLMSCPLIFQNNIIGIVNVKSYVIGAFTDNDFEILRILSSYISIALHNSMQSKELVDTNKKLKELTEKDSLTKVFNRYSLNTNIKRISKRGKKYANPYSILMIDVDFFKEYNDNYGHLAGDKCLVGVSKVLKEVCSKEKSYIYRYGGDEFLIILLDLTEERAFEVAEEIRRQMIILNVQHLYSKISNVVTLTIGVATIIKPLDEHEKVFTLADEALYVAKNRGRNNVKQLLYK